MNRRDVLQAVAGSSLSAVAFAQKPPASAASAASASPDDAGGVLAASLWMDKWIERWRSAGKDVEGMLYLGRFTDPFYFLTKPIAWKPNADQGSELPKVTVPVGFVTDFASIPRAFWSLLRPDGDYAYAAVIHDYLYWNQALSREQSDLVFKFAMQDFKIGPAEVATIFAGVRAGGAGPWKENSKLKAGGERRVLKTPPKDPRIKWVDYKKRADVFRK
jgi:Protein of unknown function (DUF1353)